jgi:hypothetical protein
MSAGFTLGFVKASIHDEQGDCSRAAFLLFNTAKDAQYFVDQSANNNIKAWFPTTMGMFIVSRNPYSRNASSSFQEK